MFQDGVKQICVCMANSAKRKKRKYGKNDSVKKNNKEQPNGSVPVTSIHVNTFFFFCRGQVAEKPDASLFFVDKKKARPVKGKVSFSY